MRRLLDTLYDGCAWLAALFMVCTLAMVLGSIVDRFVSMPLRGMDMYAGYFMAGAGFLALAHTLTRGEHIRVTLFLNMASPGWRRVLELWSLAVAVLLSGLFAYFSVKLTWDSWLFDDRSTGFDATPLWIPQLSMAIGTVILFIALLDALYGEWRHRRFSRATITPIHG